MSEEYGDLPELDNFELDFLEEQETPTGETSIEDFLSSLDKIKEETFDYESYQTEPFENSAFDGDEDDDYYDTEPTTPPLNIDEIISHGIEIGASDVHIVPGYYINYRISSDLQAEQKYGIITEDQATQLMLNDTVISNVAKNDLMETKELDTSYAVRYGKYAGRRTRLNVADSLGNPSFTFRIITDTVMTPEEIGIKNNIMEWANQNTGLILINGPTGSGKSNTIYTMISEIQKTQSKRIVTLEKPIEYMYPRNYGNTVITQREVGKDTRTFAKGLDSAMRQDPNIIVVGEVRNTEEIDALIRAAETGHLAISSMHTISPPTTIARIQQLFTGDESQRVLSTLSESTIGFANQVLVRKKDNPRERFAVREIMPVNTDEIKECIINGDISGLKKIQIATTRSLEQQLVKEVMKGNITKQEGQNHANDILFYQKLCERFKL